MDVPSLHRRRLLRCGAAGVTAVLAGCTGGDGGGGGGGDGGGDGGGQSPTTNGGTTTDAGPGAAKLAPDDGDGQDGFGRSVALAGSTALVGAPNDEDPGGQRAGAAYVFARSGGEWSQAAKLAPGDGDGGDRFGTAVALAGSTALVGAPNDEDPNGRNAGAAYVFDGSGGGWSQAAKLAAGDGEANDTFGASVALSADGSRALVGAPRSLGATDDATGSAYVFDGSGGEWSQTATLAADDGDADDRFGATVALSGSTALVGAPNDEDPNGASAKARQSGAGSAYAFDGSGGWSQTSKLAAGDGDEEDQFGTAVALAGSTALVGAPQDEDPNGGGAAYAFDGSGGWSESTKLSPAGSNVGNAVALSESRGVVGARNTMQTGVGSGAALSFDRSGGGFSGPTTLAPGDGDTRDAFGSSVALDGTTALVGAPGDEDPSGRGAGSAYVFSL